ncbi:hypothetical protein [Persicobacter diffluens]|uniref:Metallo-beta-lactamase domain-containing protein n=1 Tax=Persicobacter diffluens TaxID=981 RepID=A0AAN4VXR8_9BACT|nr:hypothetical protein PEDI_17410 [Persicobacter diffluens]
MDQTKIHVFKAGSGDCLLVQVEPNTEHEINILIDCGYSYRATIKDELLKTIKNSYSKQLHRFIITHYDADHIQGGLSLIKENGEANNPKLFPINQVWLNTFRHLQFSKRSNGSKNSAENLVKELDKKDKLVNEIDFVGEKSARQASLLGKELLALGYNWNTDFSNRAVSAEELPTVQISSDISIQLLTPSNKRLEDLEKEFIDFLKTKDIIPTDEDILDDAFELYCKTVGKSTADLVGQKAASKKVISKESIEYFSKGNTYSPDSALPNGSSISFVLKTKNEQLLFLGDAFSEDIVKSLKQIYKQEKGEQLYFDAIKVSHHGSYNNCSPELLDTIDSERFIFSTNSKSHGHPDVETIASIINRKLPTVISKRSLIFNYKNIHHLKEFKDTKLQKFFHYEICEANSVTL